MQAIASESPGSECGIISQKFNCTVSQSGTSLSCFDVQFDTSQKEESECSISLTLVPQEFELAGGGLKQPVLLKVQPRMTLMEFSPRRVESSVEFLMLKFENSGLLKELTAQDCCVDPSLDPLCSQKCQILCHISSPGEVLLLTTKLELDSDNFRCQMPQY